MYRYEIENAAKEYWAEVKGLLVATERALPMRLLEFLYLAAFIQGFKYGDRPRNSLGQFIKR